MTLWLFIISVVRARRPGAGTRLRALLRWPVEVYTYLFRGTPLYIQLLICYTGLYSLEVVQDNALLNQFFRNALNCTLLAFVLNTCAYTVEIFAGAIRNIPMASSKRHAPMAARLAAEPVCDRARRLASRPAGLQQ